MIVRPLRLEFVDDLQQWLAFGDDEVGGGDDAAPVHAVVAMHERAAARRLGSTQERDRFEQVRQNVELFEVFRGHHQERPDARLRFVRRPV